MECSICIQETDGMVVCHDCGQEACVHCIHRYLLDHLMRPNCMNCRKSWTLSFIKEQFPSVLYNSLVEKRRRIWFTMESQKSRCSQCGVHQEENTTHVCHPEHLTNWKTILETSVPCPGCKIPIQKSSGCYQMWCTLCCTAFDWKSGQLLVTHQFHNPHYSEYQRQKQQQRKNIDWSEMEIPLRTSGRSISEQRRWLFFVCLLNRIQRMLLDHQEEEECPQEILEEFVVKSQQLVQKLLHKQQWSSCHQEMMTLIDQFNHKNEFHEFPFRIRAFTMITLD